jgi:hypothetical protein
MKTTNHNDNNKQPIGDKNEKSQNLNRGDSEKSKKTMR